LDLGGQVFYRVAGHGVDPDPQVARRKAEDTVLDFTVRALLEGQYHA